MFRFCKRSDFEKNGVVMDESLKNSFEERFCPDDNLDEILKLKNGYAHISERDSF